MNTLGLVDVMYFEIRQNTAIEEEKLHPSMPSSRVAITTLRVKMEWQGGAGGGGGGHRSLCICCIEVNLRSTQTGATV